MSILKLLIMTSKHKLDLPATKVITIPKIRNILLSVGLHRRHKLNATQNIDARIERSPSISIDLHTFNSSERTSTKCIKHIRYYDTSVIIFYIK